MTPGSIPEPILQQLAGKTRHDPGASLVRLAASIRAQEACEYCLLPALGQFQIDQVIPSARWQEYVSGRIPGILPVPDRRGPDHLENFAWSCPFCNGAKGRQVTRRIGRRTHRLYDPRRDVWYEHFGFAHRHLLIVGLSAIGAATVAALGMNDPSIGGPLGSRHDAIVLGIYPPPQARNARAD